jgi:hypothetical protein
MITERAKEKDSRILRCRLSFCPYVSMITDPIFQDHHLNDLAEIYHELSVRSIAASAQHRSHPFKIRNL